MNIARMRKLADSLRNQGNYEDALTVYDEVRESVWCAVGTVQNEMTSFSTSYLGDSFKTQLNFRNSFSSQATSNLFKKWFSLDVDQTYNEFVFTTYGRLQCYSHSISLCAVITADAIYNEYLILQSLILANESDEWLQGVFKIGIPTIEHTKLKKVRFNYPDHAVKKMIVENAVKLKTTDWFGVNISLLEYLTNIGDHSSEFFSTISRIVGPYSSKGKTYNKKTNSKYDQSKKENRNDYYNYENYEKYERYEKYEKYERKSFAQDTSFDVLTATEIEKQKYFGNLLGLSGRITKSHIRKKYIELISKYHPDKVADLGDELKVVAERKTKEINAAYQWMKIKYDL